MIADTTHGGAADALGGAGDGAAAEWQEFVDEQSGQPYRYNQLTGDTQWEMPVAVAVAQEAAVKGRDRGGSRAAAKAAVPAVSCRG